MNKFRKAFCSSIAMVIGMLLMAAYTIFRITGIWTGITAASGDLAIMTAFYMTIAIGFGSIFVEGMLYVLLKDSISFVKENR